MFLEVHDTFSIESLSRNMPRAMPKCPNTLVQIVERLSGRTFIIQSWTTTLHILCLFLGLAFTSRRHIVIISKKNVGYVIVPESPELNENLSTRKTGVAAARRSLLNDWLLHCFIARCGSVANSAESCCCQLLSCCFLSCQLRSPKQCFRDCQTKIFAPRPKWTWWKHTGLGGRKASMVWPRSRKKITCFWEPP